MGSESVLDRLYHRVIEPGLCAACGACVGRCPYLIKFKGKTVKLDSCEREHGSCYAYCPMAYFDPEAVSSEFFSAPYDDGGLGNVLKVMASRSASSEIVSMAQGGGTVTSLMIMALEDGLIDSAILTRGAGQDGLPYGIVARTPEEIVSCAGSKFAGAHSLEVLKVALDEGCRKIGVVALPCQVRSLRKMALYDVRRENLKERISLIIGLFCNWSFSARELTACLAEKTAGREVKRFDIPPPPANVLTLETDQGIQSISLDELRHLIQEACRHCPDMTSEFSDVSAGMYEGRPGWNTLIVRTPAGRSLVERAVEKGVLETEPFPDSNLEHLRRAGVTKKERAADTAPVSDSQSHERVIHE